MCQQAILWWSLVGLVDDENRQFAYKDIGVI